MVPSRDELCAYWKTVANNALAFLGRRPLKLVRRVKGTTFYHMGPLPEIPPAVNQLRLEKRTQALYPFSHQIHADHRIPEPPRPQRLEQ